MSPSTQFLNPSEAAKRLGVSAKALRLYEQRGLIAPLRTEAGWRAYGPEEMARAGEIAALRALGLNLGQVARVLGGDARSLEPALAAHQAILEGQVRQLAETVERVAAREPTWPSVRRRSQGSLRTCLNRPPNSTSHSTSLGHGAVNGSSCTISDG